MKPLSALVCVLVVALTATGAANSAAVRSGVRTQDRVVQKSIAGINVVTAKTGVEDVVVLRGSLPAGEVFNPPGNPALAMLVAGMLDKGTLRSEKAAVSKRLSDIGATVSFGADANMMAFSAKFLSEDLAAVIAVLAEELRAPSFRADELAAFKQQLSARLRSQFENTDLVANNTFARAVYPAGHPNHSASLEELLAGVESATVEDLKKFYAAHYGPAHMNLVAVGDLDVAQLQSEIGKNFTGWQTGQAALVPLPRFADRSTATDERSVLMAGKTSVSIIWGQATGLEWDDPGALALRVGTSIFGSGFAGRLMANVRDKEGLTYQISAGSGNDVFSSGEWRISASFAPELLEKGLASTRQQLETWIDGGVTAAELESSKRKLITRSAISMTTPDGLAFVLLDAIHRGAGLDYLDEFPRQVEALTLDEVNIAIRKIRPSELVLVKVGTLPQGPSSSSKSSSPGKRQQ